MRFRELNLKRLRYLKQLFRAGKGQEIVKLAKQWENELITGDVNRVARELEGKVLEN